MADYPLIPETKLSNAKRALFAQWCRGQTVEQRPPSGIPYHQPGNGASAPLSFGQQQLWFFNQMQPHSPLYNIPVAMRLSGNLQMGALQKALDAIVGRHQILRTRFEGGSPEPVQLLHPSSSVPLCFTDLRSLPESDREAEMRRRVTEEIRRPFDLGVDLLIRARLIQIAEREWALVLVMHHIGSDVWSWRLLCRELGELYEAFLSNREPSLAQSPMQYTDFAAWQFEALRTGSFAEHLAYWRRNLAGGPSLLDLPHDYPRPAVQAFRGACECLRVSAALNTALDELSRSEGVTLFMVLLSAFYTLIHRYTGLNDLLIGSPTAGRTRTEFEGSIGNFVNTLPLRANITGELSFRELLHRCRTVVLEALAHQDLPFEKLVEELRPERSASHLPLVQVMFALQDELALNLRLPSVSVTPLAIDTGTAKFDLTMTVVESAGSLNFCAEYDTELFQQPTIERMLRHFEQLCQAAVAHPESRLRELTLLTPGEREQILVHWNATHREYPRQKCVHELFVEQAQRNPSATAVVFQNCSLNYGELNRRANQLANYLRRLGVGPGGRVAICMERSVEMVIALLGILKAGAAYVPLDPSRALDRIRFVLEDANVCFVLTQERWLKVLPVNAQPNSLSATPSKKAANGPQAGHLQPGTDKNVPAPEVSAICLDAEWPEIRREQQDNPTTLQRADDIAYVIYTSGSTGKPKGVEISHRAVINFLHSMRQEPGLSERDVLLSVTSLSFDIAGLEIFLPLSVGATIVLADSETVLDGRRLTTLIAEADPTVMQATPSTWQLLLDCGWTGSKRLRILCGGEKLSRVLANHLLECGAELWNLYGPTETTIWSTLDKVGPATEPVPIGRPIANTQTYVLDEQLQPVPAGIAGELYIGGDGLARGYLNRPELNAEKFIPNPFGKPGTRLYRTGDRARYLADGRIEFLGRSDHQVKIRGHRVELGEIESALSTHPAVRRAVAVLREDTPGDPRFIAYFVAESDCLVNATDLRRFLERKIPDYALPSAFIALEELPLGPSGKIDRRALPEPVNGRPVLDRPMIVARSPAEEALAAIWREVLGVPQVGVEDNFFELGGHSLKITQILSRVRRAFGVDLPFAQFFQGPTIAEQAVYIEKLRGKDPITNTIGQGIIQRRTAIRPSRELSQTTR